MEVEVRKERMEIIHIEMVTKRNRMRTFDRGSLRRRVEGVIAVMAWPRQAGAGGFAMWMMEDE